MGASRHESSRGCKDLYSSICRVAEGEATPAEAMRTARHLTDCTACRILLARERRLAAMLDEGLADPLQVGEDFVRAVMDTLPHGPPPPPAPKEWKRWKLRLASLAGLIVAAALDLAARRGIDLPSGTLWTMVPDLEAPTAGGSFETAQRVGGFLLLALGRLATGFGISTDLGLSGLLTGFASLCPFLLVAALASASVLLAAMRGILGRARSRPA